MTLSVWSEKVDWLPIQIGESPKFGNVDGAFAGLALVHERVRHSQAKRNFTLRQAAFGTCGNQSSQHTLIVGSQFTAAPLAGAPRLRFLSCCHTLKCG